MTLELGLFPWQLDALDPIEQEWIGQVAIWSHNRHVERDQKMIDAIARIMGAKR